MLRRALPGFDPGLRVLAEGLPAADGVIDLLCIDARARLVVVCTDLEGGAHGGALALARALGIRRFLTVEMPGWLQLIPDLELDAGASIRLLLLLTDASGPVYSAIEALPVGWIEPVIYRPFSHRGDDFLLLEHAGARPARPDEPTGLPSREAAVCVPPETAPVAASAADAVALPGLRSGISEGDFARAHQGRRAGHVAASPARPRFDVTLS